MEESILGEEVVGKEAQEVLEKAIADGVVVAGGGWIKFGDKSLGRGLTQATETVAGDPELLQALKVAVGLAAPSEPKPEMSAEDAAAIGRKIAGSKPKVTIGSAPEGVDLRTLGMREHAYAQDRPVQTEEIDGRKMMEIRTVQVRQNLRQPVLTLDEAKQLGPQKWHEWSVKPEFMTCVVASGVNRFRFLVTKQTYQELEKAL